MTYWACAISEKLPAQQRLAQAIELAEECGLATDRVFLPVGVVVAAPLGVAVVTSRVAPRGQVWFVRDDAADGAVIDANGQVQIPG